jgi:NifU-like protein involved in Fe-S cluster formation
MCGKYHVPSLAGCESVMRTNGKRDHFFARVIDHFTSPRNRGALAAPCSVGSAAMPGGAPTMTLYLRWRDGRVEATGFEAAGCGVGIAACSMLTEVVRGRSAEECQSILTSLSRRLWQRGRDALEWFSLQLRSRSPLPLPV